MIRRNLSVAVLGLALASLVTATGCWNPTYGPRFGIFAYPIPLTPFLQDREEDRAWENERYKKVPILEPFTPGGPHVALDPPSQDEIMRALEKAHRLEGGLPLMYEVQRNNVRTVVEQLADSVDEPRVYPLIGPAQVHHARYKCTVYYSQVTRVGWPIPYTIKNEDAQEVIYIDHDHLHMVGNVDAGPGAPGSLAPAAPPIPSAAIGAATPPAGPAGHGPLVAGTTLPPAGPFRMAANRQ